MVKGASIKFTSYAETVPKILELLKIQWELKKHDKIVLKPYLSNSPEESTPKEFVEAVLKFCLQNKNPIAEVSIVEGADNAHTSDLFDSLGYKSLAEKYSVSLIDLNESETEVIDGFDFTKFNEINYPTILKNSFVISLPKLVEHEENEMIGSLSNMLGAFPGEHYRGFLSLSKKKIKKYPMRYAIHDITRCKMPDFAIVDASSKGVLLAGLPLEIDKQAAKLLGKDWKDVSHLKLIDKTISEKKEAEAKETEVEAQ